MDNAQHGMIVQAGLRLKLAGVIYFSQKDEAWTLESEDSNLSVGAVAIRDRRLRIHTADAALGAAVRSLLPKGSFTREPIS